MNRGLLVGGILATVTAISATANAAVFTATDGSASANITVTPDGGNTDMTIVLTNLTSADATGGAANLLTGLNFAGLSNFTVVSESGSQEFNFSSGSHTNGTISSGTFNPGWDTSSGKLYFNGFGGGGIPIIGGPADSPTAYPNGNSSLASGPHGTDIYETATFNLTASGSFDLSSVESVTFLFNTSGNISVTGTPGTGSGVPEPASLGVMGLGAAGLLIRRRK